MLAHLGPEGTLVFPTICQRDWEHVYENWHLDAPSDVGYLTNYFRKLPGARRSDQATHSVAAMGKHAEYLTATHGVTGRRYGTYGDTPFAADSPWQKMYDMGAKVLFLGCTLRACTYRHFAEYVFMNEYLKKAEGHPEYEGLKAEIWSYDRYSRGGVWAALRADYAAEVMERENPGSMRRAKCGEADLLLFSVPAFVDTALRLLRSFDDGIFGDWPPVYTKEANLAWLRRVDALK